MVLLQGVTRLVPGSGRSTRANRSAAARTGWKQLLEREPVPGDVRGQQLLVGALRLGEFPPTAEN
jgi:hypothetical protein